MECELIVFLQNLSFEIFFNVFGRNHFSTFFAGTKDWKTFIDDFELNVLDEATLMESVAAGEWTDIGMGNFDHAHRTLDS